MAITKWRLFINFEKEEQWLNKMATEGLNLISFEFDSYSFEEGPPGEYIYRIELLKGEPTDEQAWDYLASMEDYGIECVDTYNNWAFFPKKKQRMGRLKFIRILNLKLITIRESLI